MTAWDVHPYRERTERQIYIAEGPIDFATWLKLAENIPTELVKGVMIDKVAAQYPHEWIFAWLFHILGPYVRHQRLGMVLGSRTAVKITENDGRLPDLVFVREDNAAIIRHDAIHGVPDLVIEIVSENDRPSDLIPLEADYRHLGVPEIVFIDQRRKRVRYVHKTGDSYSEEYLTNGRLTFASVPAFWIEVDWLFAEEKPDEFTVTKNLIEAAAGKL